MSPDTLRLHAECLDQSDVQTVSDESKEPAMRIDGKVDCGEIGALRAAKSRSHASLYRISGPIHPPQAATVLATPRKDRQKPGSRAVQECSQKVDNGLTMYVEQPVDLPRLARRVYLSQTALLATQKSRKWSECGLLRPSHKARHALVADERRERIT